MARTPSVETLQKQIAALKAERDAALSRAQNARAPADPNAPSEFFANADASAASKKANLSQTARHFESAHPDFMQQLKRENNNNLLTMKQFHAALAAKLRI